MSRQQVNLYLPELRPRKELLLSSQAMVYVLMFAVLLTLLSVWGGIRNSALKGELQQMQQALAQVDAELMAATAKIPPSRAALIQQEVDQLKVELASRERIYALIHQQNLGNSEGFGEPLLALARQHQSNISIHNLELVQGGRQLYLSGSVTSAEALPQYIQRLQIEPSLQATRFGRLVLERNNGRDLAFSTGPTPGGSRQ